MSDDIASSASRLLRIFRQELSRAGKGIVNVTLMVHRQADPDALCSASGLSSVLAKSFPQTQFAFKIVAPQGASSLGSDVCTKLGIKFEERLNATIFAECDLLVVLDTGDIRLLDPYVENIRSSPANKIVIDHHAASALAGSWPHFNHVLVDSKATSVCEIIANGFKQDSFDARAGKTLLVGLLFDSQHLGIATAATLEAALKLVRAGAEIEEAKSVLRRMPDRSETLAKIKSAQRVQYEEFEGFIFLKTEVSSFHASVARMLLDLGGDVGIAFGKSEGEARLSVRCTQAFHKKTGIDFGAVSREISESSGLLGGGHPTAASIAGAADPQTIETELISSIKLALQKKW
ncbi:MAG: DHH family phosphoesterase [Nitrososphaerota archaeon]|nr:DHH family phosphoesterase [Nitrososphaerota archaeon]